MSTVEQFYWPPGFVPPFGVSGIYRDALARTGLRVVTPATAEQLTVEEVALHLRLDAYGSPPDYPERLWLEAAITAAREVIEWQTGLILAPQTIEIGLRAFPADCMVQPGISLMTGPLLGVTSVTYFDGAADQVLDPTLYTVDAFALPGVVYPAYNQSWPTAALQPNSIRIQFQAGYNTPGDSPQDAPLPKSLRAAMLLMVGHLYKEREATTNAANIEQIPLGISALCERYRIRSSMA